MNCRRCGTLNAEEKEFCRQCGASLHWLSVTGPEASPDRQGMVGLAVAAMGLVFGLILIYFPPFPGLLGASSPAAPANTPLMTATAGAASGSGQPAQQTTPTATARINTAPAPATKVGTKLSPTATASGSRAVEKDFKGAAPIATRTPVPAAGTKPIPTLTPSRTATIPPTMTPSPVATAADLPVDDDGSDDPPADEEPEEVPPEDLPEDDQGIPTETPTPPRASPTPGAPTGEDAPNPETPSPDAATYLNSVAPIFARGRESFVRFADQWMGTGGYAARLKQDPANTPIVLAAQEAVDTARNEVDAAVAVVELRQAPPELQSLGTKLEQALAGARGALDAAIDGLAELHAPSIDQATELAGQSLDELARAAADLETARAQSRAQP